MGGVSPTQQLRRGSLTGVYSPLMVLTDASDICDRHRAEEKDEERADSVSPERPTSSDLGVVSEEESEGKRWSVRDERARKKLFVLSADGKVGSRESAYMGWATPTPQLGQLRQRWEKEAGEGGPQES